MRRVARSVSRSPPGRAWARSSLGGSRQGSRPVETDRACELDAVEAGNQPPNLRPIEARIGIVKIHAWSATRTPPQSGDELARPRTSQRRRRNTGGVAPAPGMPRPRAVAL